MKLTNSDYFRSSDAKKLPKEYLMLKLRILINKKLYEKEIISFDIYTRMQQILINKMDKLSP